MIEITTKEKAAQAFKTIQQEVSGFHLELPLIERAEIRNGDLLAWGEGGANGVSDFWLKLIMAVTGEDFGHVGVAWRASDGHGMDELFASEANMPRIGLKRLTSRSKYYCIPMGLEWDQYKRHWLLSKAGMVYGYLDAVRSGFGFTTSDDNRYQCVEYADDFYNFSGIKTGKKRTPGAFVKDILKVTGSQIHLVI